MGMATFTNDEKQVNNEFALLSKLFVESKNEFNKHAIHWDEW